MQQTLTFLCFNKAPYITESWCFAISIYFFLHLLMKIEKSLTELLGGFCSELGPSNRSLRASGSCSSQLFQTETSEVFPEICCSHQGRLQL